MHPIDSLYRVEIDSPTPGRWTTKVTSQAAVRFYNKRVTAKQWTKNQIKTSQTEAVWPIRRVGTGESKRKFRFNKLPILGRHLEIAKSAPTGTRAGGIRRVG